MKIKHLLAGAVALFGLSSQAQAGNILLTEFNYSSPAFAQIEANLEAAGHTVDIVSINAGGDLANAMSMTDYDQIFLFDVADRLFLNSDDTNALNLFWNMHQGLVVDTRSYGFYFQPENDSEKALMNNVAANLDASGGGVWVGTDHAPTWSNNADAFLSAIGVSAITGSYSDAVNYADPSSVLLDGVTPGDLWGAGASVGRAPIGIQSNGIEMFAHFGHDNGNSVLPYISASFDLQGVDPGPDPIPAPAMFGLFIMFAGMMLGRRSK